jgi:hypothetical protein
MQAGPGRHPEVRRRGDPGSSPPQRPVEHLDGHLGVSRRRRPGGGRTARTPTITTPAVNRSPAELPRRSGQGDGRCDKARGSDLQTPTRFGAAIPHSYVWSECPDESSSEVPMAVRTARRLATTCVSRRPPPPSVLFGQVATWPRSVDERVGGVMRPEVDDQDRVLDQLVDEILGRLHPLVGFAPAVKHFDADRVRAAAVVVVTRLSGDPCVRRAARAQVVHALWSGGAEPPASWWSTPLGRAVGDARQPFVEHYPYRSPDDSGARRELVLGH